MSMGKALSERKHYAPAPTSSKETTVELATVKTRLRTRWIDAGEGGYGTALDRKLNVWLDKNPDVEIIDIRYSSAWIDNGTQDSGMTYSALVIYREAVRS